MATKAEERKALAQIQKIVAGLGQDSYIGMAFEGCFEIAEENIENDWGCSMKQRADAAEEKIGEYKTIRDELVAECKKAEEHIEEYKAENERLKRKLEDNRNAYNNLLGDYQAAKEKQTENFMKAEALQQEIIKLKARLFDMMEAQGA